MLEAGEKAGLACVWHGNAWPGGPQNLALPLAALLPSCPAGPGLTVRVPSSLRTPSPVGMAPGISSAAGEAAYSMGVSSVFGEAATSVSAAGGIC